MSYPNIIAQVLNQLGEDVKMTEPGHWQVIKAYCEYYGREDETRVDPEGAHTKKDCFRLARKFGYFHLGMR